MLTVTEIALASGQIHLTLDAKGSVGLGALRSLLRHYSTRDTSRFYAVVKAGSQAERLVKIGGGRKLMANMKGEITYCGRRPAGVRPALYAPEKDVRRFE